MSSAIRLMGGQSWSPATMTAGRRERCRSADGSLMKARMSRRWCTGPAARPAWTDTSLRPGPRPKPSKRVGWVGYLPGLLPTAMRNAETRSQRTASRARIIAAADGARRRFERDLHDGAQQRLVSLGLELRTAEASVPSELPALREQMSHIMTSLTGVSDDLRELSRGIHPAILSRGGLGPALNTLARRSTVPVELRLGVDGRRLPDSVEVATYYVVA